MPFNKKYVDDLRMPSGPSTKSGAGSDSAPPADSGDDMDADLFGDAGDDGDGDEGDDIGADLSAIADEDLIAEARKRGLSLDAPKSSKSKPAPRGPRMGSDDGEADSDSYS